MKNKWGHRLLATLALTALLLPCLTWMLSAFGFPVRSLFDEDGWRWLFLHATKEFFSYVVQVCLLGSMACGSLHYVGFFSRGHSMPAVWMSFGVVLVCVAALCFAATSSHSPLLGVTGHLFPSPFLYGLPAALSLTVMLASLTYGLLTMRIRRLRDVSFFLIHGIRRYAGFLMAVMLLSFLYSCIKYSFPISNL